MDNDMRVNDCAFDQTTKGTYQGQVRFYWSSGPLKEAMPAVARNGIKS